MDLINFKDQDKVILDAIALLDNTALNKAGSSGKICRLLVNIVASLVGDTYTALKLNHYQAFLSTAEGDGLDAIGYMVNCPRIGKESDSDYRYRISQSTLTAATCNETSIRLAALSVTGVQSIVMKQYTYGSGSYSIYVVTEYAITPDSILSNVKTAVAKVTAYGIKFDIMTPKIIDVKLGIVVAFTQTATDEDRVLLCNEVKAKTIDLMNSMNMGQSIVVKDIVNKLILVDAKIKNVYISSMKLNDIPVFITDQNLRWNQRFLASSAEGAITVQGDA